MAKKKSKKKSKAKSKKQQKNVILAVIENPAVDQEEKQVVIDLIHHTAEAWTGRSYTPPGSLPELIVQRFETHTDISLDIPFFITTTLVAGILVKEGVTIDVQDNELEMSVWVNLLCDSGASKSYTLGKIRNSLQDAIEDKSWTAVELIWEPGAQSAAQFMREWAGYEDKEGNTIEVSRNRSIMVVDEATDFFSAIKNPKGHLFGMYQQLLKAYGHDTIQHGTIGGGKLTVEKPVICFLGLATPGRFIEQITEMDIEGGFYYRWAHKKADSGRSMKGHAIYPGKLLEGIDAEWKKLIESIQHKKYTVSESAVEHFITYFDQIVDDPASILPGAYVRRMSWMLHRFALLYHIFLGKGGQQEIGIDAYQWAQRLITVFADTASEIIKEKLGTESRQHLEKVEKLIARRTAAGKATAVRDVVMYTKIPAKDAKLYLQMAAKPVENQAPKIISGRPNVEIC